MGHTAKLCHTTHTHIGGTGPEAFGYDLTAGGRVGASAAYVVPASGLLGRVYSTDSDSRR